MMACRPRAPTASEAGAVGCECVRCSVVLDDGANTFYDKLEGENTAGSDGSGMKQPVESFYSFWPEIDEDILMKRYGGDGSRVLGWIRTFRFCFITYFASISPAGRAR